MIDRVGRHERQGRRRIELENLERVFPAQNLLRRLARIAEIVGDDHLELNHVVVRRAPLRNRNRNRLQRPRRRDRNIDQCAARTVRETGPLAFISVMVDPAPARHGRRVNPQRIDHLAVRRRVDRQVLEPEVDVDRRPRLLLGGGMENGACGGRARRYGKVEILRQQRLDVAARGQLHADAHDVTALRAQVGNRAGHRLRARNRRQIDRLTQ